MPKGEKAGPDADSRARRPAGVEIARVPTGRVHPWRRGETRMRRSAHDRWRPRMRAKTRAAGNDVPSRNGCDSPDDFVTIPDTVVTATRTPLPATGYPRRRHCHPPASPRLESGAHHPWRCAEHPSPGLHASPSGGPGGQSSVFVRGTNSAHVLVLRDGIRSTTAPTRPTRSISARHAVRHRAYRNHPRADGGTVWLRRDRWRDQPDSRRGTAGPPRLEMDLSGGYPATIAGTAQASGSGPWTTR